MPTSGTLAVDQGLELALQFIGLEGLAERYEEFLRDIQRERAGISEEEIKAAQQFREHAAKVAGQVLTSQEVTGSGKDAARQVEQIHGRLALDFMKITDSMGELRSVFASLAGATGEGDDEKPDEDEGAGGGGDEDPSKKGSILGKVGKFFNVFKQASSAWTSGVSRVASGMEMPMTGAGPMAIVLLLIEGMFYGVKNAEEKRVQAEGYAQRWYGTIRATTSEGFQRGQESARELGRELTELTLTYRMSKEEAATVVRTLSGAGLTIDEVSHKTSIVVEGVQQNLVIATAAIDQKLRLQTGTAAQATTRLMRQYGYDASIAVQKVARLALLGRESGIGIETFMNDVMDAGQQMRRYGADIEDAVSVASSLKRNLMKKGLSTHLAGSLAMMATGEIAEGLAGMSEGMQMVMAQHMGMGQGIAAYYVLNDARFRKAPGTQAKMAVALVEIAKAGGAGTTAQIAEVVRQLAPHLSPQAAMQLVENVDALKGAHTSKEQQHAAEQAFNDAFESQQDRTANYQVKMREIMEGMAESGAALFNMLVSVLAEVVIMLRRVPLELLAWIDSILPGRQMSSADYKQLHAMRGATDRILDQHMQYTEDFKEGISRMGHGIAGMVDSPGMAALTSALSGSPEEVSRAAKRVDPRKIESLFAGDELGGAHATGGGAVTADVDAATMLSLSSAARNRDVAYGQQAVLGLPDVQQEIETSGGGSGHGAFTDVDVIITNVTFENNVSGHPKAHVSYRVVPGARAHGVTRSGLPATTAATAAATSGATTVTGGAGLVKAFPLGDPATAAIGQSSYIPASFAGQSGSHGAYDIFASGGTPVYAPAGGRVTVHDGDMQSFVEIADRRPDGLYRHRLMHLQPHSIPVGSGSTIEAGQQIGELAPFSLKPVRTGSERPDDLVHEGRHYRKKAPHLHYEIIDPRGQKVDFYKDLRSSDPRTDKSAIGAVPDILAARARKGDGRTRA